MFQRILVPLDGSEHSLRALDIAIQVAKKFEGKITLVHVYSAAVKPVMMPEAATAPPPMIPIMTPLEVSKIAEAARKAGSGILMGGAERVKAEGVPVETILLEGNTVQEIIKAAGEGKFDLIVMGARGISKIREILLGSVSDGVLRNAPCPVLIVK